MANRQELILKRLQEEGSKTAGYFRGLSAESFGQQVYITGPLWRVRDVLAHFVSAEQTLQFYGRQILAGGPGAPADFVIDEFNATQVAGLRDAPTAQLVDDFAAARAKTAEMVAGMADADFYPLRRHPRVGNVPREQMLKLGHRPKM